MLAEERRMEMFRYLKKVTSATTEDLINQFGASGSTIRRDLEELSKKKLIIRTHNGAVVNSPNVETGFLMNYNSMLVEKRNIAKKVLKYINNGDFIALSGGSTCHMIAEEIANSNLSELFILTNSVNQVVYLLQADKDFEIILAGGIPKKGTYECVGEIPIEIIKKFNVDKFFLGVDGLSVSGGASFNSVYEADVARVLFKRSKEVYAVADHSKFLLTKPAHVCDLSELTGIITDDTFEFDKDEYKKLNIKIL